jgi:hypothetical protein
VDPSFLDATAVDLSSVEPLICPSGCGGDSSGW